MAKIVEDEKGQALPLALIALGVGAVLITPFLESVSTNLLASRKYTESMVEQYAADAGIEDVIWRINYEGVVITPGDTLSYTLNESVNGITPSVSVTRVSGGPGGGPPGPGGPGGGPGGGAGGKTYDIASIAGDTTVQASVNELAGDVSIVTWQRN